MRLLITPSNQKYSFVILDTDTKHVIRKCSMLREGDDGADETRARHRPFGITWDSEWIYVANRRHVCVYDKHYWFQGKIENVLSQNPHQILHHDGKIYACLTDLECLAVIDLETKTAEHYQVGSWKRIEKPTTPNDRTHHNALLIRDGLLYVLLNNRKRTTSQIDVLDMNRMRYIGTVHTPMYQAHNLMFDNSFSSLDTGGTRQLWTEGRFVELGIPEGHFVRGMASCNGVTAVAHFPREARRYNREFSDSTVKLVENGKVVEEHRLPDIGAVNDMRSLDGIDCCHHGIHT